LCNDSNYPWIILIPRRKGIEEIYQLSPDDRHQLLLESSCISEALVEIFSPDKLNIATIGNIVPQLHMHHVCRYKKDACWPKPIWGQVSRIPYDKEILIKTIKNIRLILEPNLISI
jgi:diadenosine tetraphosphate (Ap4A) HIT family hydrolase